MFKKIAHSSNLPSLGNKDFRALQDLIHAEKSFLTGLQKLSVDLSKSSDALKTWGLGEGEDLGDVLTHSASILSHVSNALYVFASHEQTVREMLKSIRTREEKLDETRNRRKAVGSKAEAAEKKLSKMGTENKNLPSQTDLLKKLHDEIRKLDYEIMMEEARIGDFKRRTTKSFMTLKLGGLLEFAEKAAIVGELGKLLIEEIPLQSTVPGESRAMYMGREKTDKLEQEVSRCVNEVVFSASNILDSAKTESERYDYSTNPSADNSYSNDQNDHPPSQPLTPVGTQNNKWSAVTPAAPTPSDYYGGTNSPTTQFRSPRVGNEDFHTDHTDLAREGTAEGNYPMPVYPDVSDRPRGSISDAPPSIDVNFTSEFNPYETPIQPPLMVTNLPVEDSWDRSTNNSGNVRTEIEEDQSQEHRTVRFQSPVREQPSPELNIPGHRPEDRSEAPSQVSEEPKHIFTIPRVPPPSARGISDDNEESRNLAAAREISREMDSLSRQTPQEGGVSPLVPPTLPFANRTVSPGPPSPISTMPDDLVPPRISIDQRPRSGSGASSGGPIPREFPAPPPSTRTISAGAFKRGPNRTSNSDGEVRKRALPSSPYPPHRLNSAGSVPQRERDTQPAVETSNAPPSSFRENDSHNEVGWGRESESTRQSMDLPPSYKSVDSHPGLE